MQELAWADRTRQRRNAGAGTGGKGGGGGRGGRSARGFYGCLNSASGFLVWLYDGFLCLFVCFFYVF